VKLPKHSLLLPYFAAKKLTIAEAYSPHSTEALNRSTAVDFASSQKEELQDFF
jgi:hypothetical protein